MGAFGVPQLNASISVRLREALLQKKRSLLGGLQAPQRLDSLGLPGLMTVITTVPSGYLHLSAGSPLLIDGMEFCLVQIAVALVKFFFGVVASSTCHATVLI